MGALKKPTIEGFVDKLIEENHISAKETEKVADILTGITDGLSPEEKAFFIRTLSDRVDAVESELITQNGLNYAGFEGVVQEVSKVVEKERRNKNENANQTAKDENAKEELLEKDLEKEEKIKENEEFIDSFFNDFLGLNDVEITKEEKREMAEWLYKADKLDSLEEQYRDKGESQEDALMHAMKDLGMTESDLAKPEMIMAQAQILGRKRNQLKEKGHSDEEIEKIVFADDSLSTRSMKREIEREGRKESFDAVRLIALGAWKKIKEKSADKREDWVIGEKAGNRLDIELLRWKIEKREDAKESIRKIDRKIKEIESEKDDSQKNLKDLYKKMTDEYLLTGKTISSLFENYKKKGLLGDLEFGDVLDGIIDEIRPYITERFDPSYIIELKIHERNCRIEELTLQEYEEAQKQGNLVKDNVTRNKNPKIIAEMKKKQEKNAEHFKDFKKHLITKRNLNPNKKIWDSSELFAEPEEIEIGKTKTESLEQVLKNRDNVNRDRNAIIKLSKEQKISSNEAARQYFSENPEALKSYTKEERKALTGEQYNEKKSVKGNRVLKQINTSLIDRNYKSMERIAAELENLRSEVENAEERGDSAKRVVGIKLKIQKLEARYQKIEDNNKKLENPKNVKTAGEILDKKVTELSGKAIFNRYITTGKSAVEIYQEFLASKREITFDDVLSSIENESKGYLLDREIKQLIAIEKRSFENMTKMELWKEQKAIAEKKNDSSEVSVCQNEIDGIQSVFNEGNEIRVGYKDRLLTKTGITRASYHETNESSEKSAENNQVESPKLELAEIETTSGVIPNVNAIAQKGNVTRSTVKSVFSKIFRLKQEKGPASKEELKDDENKTDADVDQEVMQ